MSLLYESFKRSRFIGRTKEGTFFELTLLAILLVSCGFGFYLARHCDGQVALHFNLTGEVTRWGSVKDVYKETILTSFIAIFVMLCAYAPNSIHMIVPARTPRQVALKVRAARVVALVLGFLPLVLTLAMTRQVLLPVILLVAVVLVVVSVFAVMIYRSE